MRQSLTILMLVSSLIPAVASAEEPAVWPQWRGPSRDGIVGGKTWPSEISNGKLKQNYRIELGPSYSGPIVSADKVFVTETVDAEREVVRALDRKTGKELWSTEWTGALSVPFFAKANGDWIRATPAFDGTNLYVAGMRDVLVCLDAESGAEKWRVDFVEKLGTALPQFGFVCSPLVDGNAIYVQAGAAVCKLNKDSGDIIWRTLDDGGGMMGSAFSSPIIATIRGTRQLVVQTRSRLAGVDLESGKELWGQDVPAFRGMNILTPTVVGDSVFTSSYGGGSFLYNVADAEVTDLWRNKVQGYMSSPIVHDGHVYLHLRNQRFACIDLETGKEDWISKPYGQYWSLVAQGSRILALDERGDLLLLNANPEEFDLVDSFHVSDEPTWAHLAVCGDEIFIRDLKGITSYTWSE